MACYSARSTSKRPLDAIDLTHRSFVARSPPPGMPRAVRHVQASERAYLPLHGGLHQARLDRVYRALDHAGAFDEAGDRRFHRLAAFSTGFPDAVYNKGNGVCVLGGETHCDNYGNAFGGVYNSPWKAQTIPTIHALDRSC